MTFETPMGRLDQGINRPNGEWCPDCALETMVDVPLVAIDADGVTEVATVVVCRECGHSTRGMRA